MSGTGCGTSGGVTVAHRPLQRLCATQHPSAILCMLFTPFTLEVCLAPISSMETSKSFARVPTPKHISFRDVSCFSGSGDVVWACLLLWLGGEVWLKRKYSARQEEVVQRLATHGPLLDFGPFPHPSSLQTPSARVPCQKSAIRRPTVKVASCKRVSRSWHEKLRSFKAGPVEKRRTAKPATKAGHCMCRSQHGWFRDGDTTDCTCWSHHLICRGRNRRSRSWNEELQQDEIVGLLPDRFSNSYRNARLLWSHTAKSTVLWLSIPTIAFSRVFRITLFHSFLAAVMDRWP